ncbi:MAG: radical SAM protein [Patescibacteria group bacterium]
MNTMVVPTATSQNDEMNIGKIAERVRELLPSGCQRILLINIPQVGETDFDIPTARAGRYPCFPPYGPGLLSHDLRIAGYETKLIDLNYEILSKVKEETFDYHCWQSALQSILWSFEPDLVCVSCMFSATHGSMKAVIDHTRECSPPVVIMAGGVHVTGNIRQVLEALPNVDLVIAYEADDALVAFVDFVNGKKTEKDLAQISLFYKGEFLQLERRAVPNGSELNYSPDYDDLPIGNYGKVGEIGVYRWLRGSPPAATIIRTRGCRAHCTFCSVATFNGRGTRSRDVVKVVDEMERMVRRYGIEHFMWLDDDLFRRDAAELFSEVADRKLGITWDASNGVIASATNREIVDAAAKSGCIGLSFGIESGDPEILASVKKPSGVKHFRALPGILSNHPEIFSKGFLMLGFPGETVAKIWNTINLAREIALDWYPLHVLSPFGGTDMAKTMIALGLTDEHTVLHSRLAVGPAGAQRFKERTEITSSTFNQDVINLRNPDRIPDRKELSDVWFMMEWMVNYERILGETDRLKLGMKRLHLRHIIARLPRHVALAGLFLGIVNQKLGNAEEAQINFNETDGYLEESAFWRVRFDALGLNNLLSEWRRKVVA